MAERLELIKDLEKLDEMSATFARQIKCAQEHAYATYRSLEERGNKDDADYYHGIEDVLKELSNAVLYTPAHLLHSLSEFEQIKLAQKQNRK